MVNSELEFQKRFLKVFDEYDNGLWQKMPSARFSYWSKRELWTLKDFAYLLKGKEPLEKDDDRVDYIPDSFVTYFEDLARFVMDGTLLGTLELIFPYPDAKLTHCLLSPRDWLRWAKRKEMSIPDELTPILEKETEQKAEAQDEIDPRERKTFLRIIAVLAKESGLELNNPYADAETLQLMAAKLGVELPKKKDTIASKFKEVSNLLKSQ